MVRSKGTLFVLMLMLVSFILAACGTQESTPDATSSTGETTDTSAISGEITVWGWNVAAQGLDATVASFKEKYPNVTVKVEDIGRTDVYDKLTTGLQAGGAGLPDVVQIESDRMDGYTSAFPEGFADLTAKASSYKAQFDSSKWAQSEVDGKIRSIPWDSGPTGLWYRTDLFEQAGIDPASIETWDDLISAGEKIEAATGAKLLPVDVVADDALYRMMTNQLGTCCYFNPDGNINITNEQSVMALTKIKTMYDKGLIANVTGWDGIVGATKNGDVATVPFGVWYSGTILDQAPELSGKWDVMMLPAFEPGGNRAANLGGSTLAVPASSKNVEAAWAFIEHALASKDGQNIMMEKFGLWPSFTPAYEADLYSKPVEYFNNKPIWQLFANQVNDIPASTYTKDYARGLASLVNAQSQVLTEGKDPAAALQDAANELANQTGREISQ